MTRALVVIALALALGWTQAQATWVVEALIPDTLSIRVPSTVIAFDLAASGDFPPRTFPARYAATEPVDGAMPLQVYTNRDGFWTLNLEIADITDAAGLLLIPAGQILYRVNAGPWLRSDGSPQVIYSGSGLTSGWMTVLLEFQIELLGSERAGAYGVSAVISAQHQGF